MTDNTNSQRKSISFAEDEDYFDEDELEKMLNFSASEDEEDRSDLTVEEPEIEEEIVPIPPRTGVRVLPPLTTRSEIKSILRVAPAKKIAPPPLNYPARKTVTKTSSPVRTTRKTVVKRTPSPQPVLVRKLTPTNVYPERRNTSAIELVEEELIEEFEMPAEEELIEEEEVIEEDEHVTITRKSPVREVVTSRVTTSSSTPPRRDTVVKTFSPPRRSTMRPTSPSRRSSHTETNVVETPTSTFSETVSEEEISSEDEEITSTSRETYKVSSPRFELSVNDRESPPGTPVPLPAIIEKRVLVATSPPLPKSMGREVTVTKKSCVSNSADTECKSSTVTVSEVRTGSVEIVTSTPRIDDILHKYGYNPISKLLMENETKTGKFGIYVKAIDPMGNIVYVKLNLEVGHLSFTHTDPLMIRVAEIKDIPHAARKIYFELATPESFGVAIESRTGVCFLIQNTKLEQEHYMYSVAAVQSANCTVVNTIIDAMPVVGLHEITANPLLVLQHTEIVTARIIAKSQEVCMDDIRRYEMALGSLNETTKRFRLHQNSLMKKLRFTTDFYRSSAHQHLHSKRDQSDPVFRAGYNCVIFNLKRRAELRVEMTRICQTMGGMAEQLISLQRRLAESELVLTRTFAGVESDLSRGM